MKKLYIFLFSISLIAACTKEPISQQSEEPVTVQNGILSFTNPQVFFNVVDSLNKLSLKESIGYKANEGFLSLLTIQANYSECLATATEETEYARIILEHSKFLAKGDTTTFKIRNTIVYPVINEDGIVKIGDVLYKFTEDGQILFHSNDLKQLLSINTTDNETDILKIFVYPEQTENKSSCGAYQNTGWVYNGDRRCYLKSEVIPTNWTNEWGLFSYRTYVRILGWGQKRGLFGWTDYSTYHWLNVHYKVTLNNGVTETVTNSLTQDGQTSIVYIDDVDTGIRSDADMWYFSGVFDWIDINEYTNRGMNGVTAVTQCGIYGK